MWKPRIWLTIAGALVALGAAALFFTREAPPPVPAKAPVPGAASAGDAVSGSVLAVSAEEMPILVEATGRVVSTREVVLSTKVQGTIETLSVREGSVVAAGQTLLTLDDRHILAQLAAADAELENARDRLARMEKLFSGRLGRATELYRRQSAVRRRCDGEAGGSR